MSSYPTDRRGKHFSHRFCRLLTKTATAQDLGPEACWLLAVIVHQEDAVRYQRAITFWNDQLLPLCGFGSRKRLESARSKAIDAGWLHYEPGGKSKAGRYWVTIPSSFEELADFAVDEGGDLQGRNGTANVPDDVLRDETERKTPGQKHQGGTATAHHSTLTLNPNPKGKRKKKPIGFDARTVVRPDELTGELFATAWGEWCDHRAETKKKLTKTSTAKQLKALAEMGQARAITAIDHSIANGWQGIFEPSGQDKLTTDTARRINE